MTNQDGERRDAVLAGDPIIKVLPERETVFQAGLLEADEGVPTSSPGLTAGSRAGLAFFDHVANVAFAAVVVQREIGVIQHAQQLVAVVLEALEDPIERFARGYGGAQGVELRLNRGFGFLGRQRAIGVQIAIEAPDLLPNPGNGDPVGLAER